MCGIAGLIDKRGKDVLENTIKQMTDQLIHRGPDSEGQYVWNQVGLGHRRLSIIELSEAGVQPMISGDEDYVIVFNGEIYNYIEIREQLRKQGATFQSQTDTEVIMEAYRYWGEDCVTHFNGMWAFALLDRKKNVIFASRDRMGVKPFCYFDTEEYFCFASEPKAILEIFPKERQMDETAVWRLVTNGHSDVDERTYYKNIKQLRPAHNMIIDLNTYQIKIRKYWDIEPDKFYEKWIKGKNPVKAFRALMQDAVKVRLRSDAKLGTSLSGGLDSSAIVGIMNKKWNCNVHTFSSIYEDEECNEKEYIDEVNQYNQTSAYSIYPDKEEQKIEVYKRIAYHHDGPNASASLFSGYCVYKKAGKEVKVLIDGQGADELLAGYLPYNEYLFDLMEKGGIINRVRAIQTVAILKQLNHRNVEIATDVLKWCLGKKTAMKYVVKKTEPYKWNRALFSENFLKQVENKKEEVPEQIKGHLNKKLYQSLTYESLPNILHNVDSNSMTFSVEVRCPFLDYRIVEFSIALDARYKLRRQWTKWIMRKALKDYLPKKVLYRTNKMGFPAPFARWIKEDKSGELLELLTSLDKRKIFADGVIMEYYRQHMEEQMNRSFILYRFVSLELWIRSCIESR